jgi:hypothetical protein
LLTLTNSNHSSCRCQSKAPLRNGKRSLTDKAAKPVKTLLDPSSDNKEDLEVASPEMLAELALAAVFEAEKEGTPADAGVMALLTKESHVGDALEGPELAPQLTTPAAAATIIRTSTPPLPRKVRRWYAW